MKKKDFMEAFFFTGKGNKMRLRRLALLLAGGLCGILPLSGAEKAVTPSAPAVAGNIPTPELPEMTLDAPAGREKLPETGEVAELTIRGEKAVVPDTATAPVTMPQITTVANAYLPRSTVSFAKMPLNLASAPITMNIVTAELIADQNARSFTEALKNVPGVVVYDSGARQWDSAYIRGFNDYTFIDGQRSYMNSHFDMNMVERVEVIKGQASFNFGEACPGGLVNIVTKRAQFTPHKVKIKSSIGTYADSRTYIDAGGALSDSVAYRINAGYTTKESFRDYCGSEYFSVSPAFKWKISRDTTLDMMVNYKHENRTIDPGIPYDARTCKRLTSLHTYLGEPSEWGMEINDLVGDIVLTHDFCDEFQSTTKVTHHFLYNGWGAMRSLGKINHGVMTGGMYDESQHWQNETQVSQDFTLHLTDGCWFDSTTVAGISGRASRYEWQSRMAGSYAGSIDITDPVYGRRAINHSPDNGTQYKEYYNISPYIQEKLALFDDKVEFLLGGRIDNYYFDQKANVAPTKPQKPWESQYDFAMTGYAGVLVKALDHFHPYATISNSFKPNEGSNTVTRKVGSRSVTVGQNFLDPTTGYQIEGGVKMPFCDDNLLFTASVFHIVQDNIAVSVTDGDLTYKENGGKGCSRGVELSLAGNIWRGLDITAGYALTDTEWVSSPNGNQRVGSKFANAPTHSGNLWLTYNHRDGFLKGLKYGTGIYLAGDSQTADNGGEVYINPGHISWDAMLGYRKEFAQGKRAVSGQFNFQNITDTVYYEKFSSSTVYVNTPFTMTFTLGLEF